MSNTDRREVCSFCKQGLVVKVTREITFQQMTDRGRIVCRATVPVGICDHCKAETFDADAEAAVEEAARDAYNKLPPGSGKDN